MLRYEGAWDRCSKCDTKVKLEAVEMARDAMGVNRELPEDVIPVCVGGGWSRT